MFAVQAVSNTHSQIQRWVKRSLSACHTFDEELTKIKNKLQQQQTNAHKHTGSLVHTPAYTVYYSPMPADAAVNTQPTNHTSRSTQELLLDGSDEQWSLHSNECYYYSEYISVCVCVCVLRHRERTSHTQRAKQK